MAIQVQQRYRHDRKAVIKQSGDFAEENQILSFSTSTFSATIDLCSHDHGKVQSPLQP